MSTPERNFDDESYDEAEGLHREQAPREKDNAYFPIEKSKPSHY